MIRYSTTVTIHKTLKVLTFAELHRLLQDVVTYTTFYLQVVAPVKMSFEIYATCVIPISVFFASRLW
ncbi:hypothetical protein P8452_35820 [Trifolium repens]|nr:hypothetical protein P8452_35820 [Trifolium repens]